MAIQSPSSVVASLPPVAVTATVPQLLTPSSGLSSCLTGSSMCLEGGGTCSSTRRRGAHHGRSFCQGNIGR